MGPSDDIAIDDARRSAPGEAVRLRGWKEIGRRFGVDERTAKRWEASRGLPVHRVPGEPRAPVFAYEAELASWLASRSDSEAVAAVAPATAPRRPRAVALAILAVLLLGLIAWQGWQVAAARREEARERVADVRQLARSQVAALSDRLEKQPGTVQLRAALAGEAATMLARVAKLPDASPVLRQEAAEAYRRLAIVQNATDRPSLRNRPAARQSLDTGLALLADDRSAAGRLLRARLLADAARHAAADGAIAKAPALLAAAAAAAPDPPPPLRDELALARSEVAQWQGDYRRAIASAEQVARPQAASFDDWQRQVRARDLAAEARYYGGDKRGALKGYREALAVAEAGLARFPNEPAVYWAVQRQQWNLGTTLVDAGQPGPALPLLAASRAGWMAMAARDPADESVASWVRTTRLSYGEGLAAAGRTGDAIAELSESLADRRRWLAGQPGNAERRRALVIGLNALGDALAGAGRRGEACGLFGEAAAMIRRMAGNGSLTKLDADSMQAILDQSTARHCRPAG